MTTLGNLKEGTTPAAIGIAACDPRFTTWANEAQERLAQKGRWWGTTKRIRVCVTARCITWPSGVATVEGFNISGAGVPIRNSWFEFQDNVRTIESKDCACSAQQLFDRGYTPQYSDFTGSAYIRIYPRDAADADAVVLLQGSDQNGLTIRNTDDDGSYNGVKLTLASPFADTTTLFKAPGLTGVQKPITKGYLDVYSVDSVTGEETQIATWGPSERSPMYRRSALVNLPTSCSIADTGDGCGPAFDDCDDVVAEAIVRLKPVELVVDSDWLFIQNKTAMKAAMKAMLKEDKSDYQGAAIEMNNARLALKEELAVYDPPERISIGVDLGVTMRRSLRGGVF